MRGGFPAAFRRRAVGNPLVAVATGAQHNVALAADGTVWTWGGNTAGQAGDGTATARAPPSQVAQLRTAAVWAGGHHSLALVPWEPD